VFAAAFALALEGRRGAWVTRYTVRDFERMRCLLAHDGRVGGALKPTAEGTELVSVFNEGGPPGAGRAMIRQLVERGGDRLSCIGPRLRRIYEDAGFEVVEEVGWDDRHAPVGWDYERDKRPNIYVMELRR